MCICNIMYGHICSYIALPAYLFWKHTCNILINHDSCVSVRVYFFCRLLCYLRVVSFVSIRVYSCLFLLRVYFFVQTCLFCDVFVSIRVYSCLFVSIHVYSCLFLRNRPCVSTFFVSIFQRHSK